jgi:hypothetical protein
LGREDMGTDRSTGDSPDVDHLPATMCRSQEGKLS